MEVFEKLKKSYLLLGLDDYTDIFWVIDDVKKEFYLSGPEKIQSKIIDLFRYLLQTALFKIHIGRLDEEPIKLSEEKLLAMVQAILREDWSLMRGSDRLWRITLHLTTKGRQVAKEYLQKKINLMEKMLITANEPATLKKVEEFIKKELKSSDIEEVQYEMLDAIRLLIADMVMEIGSLEDDNFIAWNLRGYESEELVESIFRKGQSLENIWIRRTDLGSKLVEKWKIEGGELVKRWHDWLREEWG